MWVLLCHGPDTLGFGPFANFDEAQAYLDADINRDDDAEPCSNEHEIIQLIES